MKLIRFAILSLLLASPAMALQPCIMDTPIELGSADILSPTKLTFVDKVRFDAVPKFHSPSPYNPEKDSLRVEFFNINWNGAPTGSMGVNIQALENGMPGANIDSLGFAPNYSGNFDFVSSSTESNSSIVYYTRQSSRLTEPQHAQVDAVTESRVTVMGTRLLAAELTIPIFRVWKTEGSVRYIAFTGEHQTLCLKSLR
jgi:hypothetical protein